MAENIVELHSAFGWKIDELGYLAGEIAKVLKMWPDFPLFILKCKGKEKN